MSNKTSDVKDIARRRAEQAAKLQSGMLGQEVVQKSSTTKEHTETLDESSKVEDNTTFELTSATNVDNTQVQHANSTPIVYTQNKSVFKKSGKKGIRDTHYPTTYQVINEMKEWIQQESDNLGRDGKGFIKAFVNTALYNAYELYLRGELELNEDYDKQIIQHFNKQQ